MTPGDLDAVLAFLEFHLGFNAHPGNPVARHHLEFHLVALGKVNDLEFDLGRGSQERSRHQGTQSQD